MLPESAHMLFTFAVLLTVFVSFTKEWFSTDLVALGGLSALLIAGVLDDGDLGRVFGNTAPMTIGAMFVLAAALTQTGVIDWIAHRFEKWAGKSMTRALLILGLIAIPLSAFMNNTPVVIVFLPVIMKFARSTELKASKLLIPLSYLSILGGTITLIGTSTNLLVSGLAKNAGQPAFGIFEISKLGVIYAAVGFLYIYFIGRHLLPARDTVSSLLDAEDTRKFSSAVEVTEDSELIGKRLTGHPMFSEKKLTIVYEVIRQGRRVDDIPLDAITLQHGDILWFRGTSKQLGELRNSPHVKMLHERAKEEKQGDEHFEVKTVEAIIGPQSSLIGKSVRASQIRRRYGILVVAVHRKGVNVAQGYQEMRLAFGDTLLMEGPTQNFLRLNEEGSFLSLNEAPVHTRLKSKMTHAIAALLLVILVSALDLISISSAALIGAVLVIAMRCLNVKEAYKSIEWNVLFMIYGMLGVGLAMDKSGAAEWIAMGVTGSLADYGPVVILAAMYLLVSVLTELVTNNAVAILMTPIAISIADSMGVDARPFLVAIMFGASASFITPIGYQTNTYVYGAGGYRFTDFMKVGIPLDLILFVVAVFLIPMFWPF